VGNRGRHADLGCTLIARRRILHEIDHVQSTGVLFDGTL
jgi:hypothetical protein